MPIQSKTEESYPIKKLKQWSRSCLNAMEDPKKPLYQQVLLRNFNQQALRPELKPVEQRKFVKRVADSYGDLVLQKYFSDVKHIKYPIEDKTLKALRKEVVCLDRKLFQTVHRYYSNTQLQIIFTMKEVRFPLMWVERASLQSLLKKQITKDKKLIANIFDEKFDSMGVGFFKFKTPTYIKKLREALDKDTITYPLDEDLRKTLYEIAYDACEGSGALFSLRSFETDELYRNLKQSLPG